MPKGVARGLSKDKSVAPLNVIRIHAYFTQVFIRKINVFVLPLLL